MKTPREQRRRLNWQAIAKLLVILFLSAASWACVLWLIWVVVF